MELEDLPIWADVKPIISRPGINVRVDYTGQINTIEEDIDVKLIETVDVLKDYGNNLGDYIVIQLRIPFGQYQKKIHKYRHNLEFTLTKKIIVGAEIDTYISRYKLVIMNSDNTVDGSILDYMNEDELNHKGFFLMKCQLINRGLEVLRVKTTGGIYRNKQTKDIILGIVDREAKKIQIDGKSILDKIDITEPANTKENQHIIIPHGTRVLDMPNYLQRNSYGIYPGGLGTYIQEYKRENVCFIYPLFDFNKYNKPIPKLIVYGMPTSRYEMVETTWMIDGDLAKIVVGESTKLENDDEKDYMDKGSGFRLPDAQAYMKKPVEMTKDGPKANRKRLAYEIAIKDRTDGINYASLDEPSNNPFLKYEQILRRSGNMLTFTWRYSNDEIIYPGMPCKYVFVKGKDIYELNGTIQQIHTVVSVDKISSSIVHVFVERKQYIEED
jgi:hypothetical protein